MVANSTRAAHNVLNYAKMEKSKLLCMASIK
jgi:hypothetical protein